MSPLVPPVAAGLAVSSSVVEFILLQSLDKQQGLGKMTGLGVGLAQCSRPLWSLSLLPVILPSQTELLFSTSMSQHMAPRNLLSLRTLYIKILTSL